MAGETAAGGTMTLARALMAALALGLIAHGSARAQSYPNRPVKIVVPVGPSGSYDILGRLIADELGKRMKGSFVVENRAGGGTIVGTKAVIASPPDGYTLLVGGLSNIVFNAGLYKNPPYDPLKDLVPVALILNISYTLVGSPNFPHKTAKDIIAAAKASPGTIKLANAGVGTGQQVVGAAFQSITGTKMLEVPYRGSSLAYPDLLSGRVDLFFDSTPAAMPYVKGGQANGIAILTAKRLSEMLNVPTMTESGVPGLEIDSWIGIFAPAKTPPEIIALLQKNIAVSGSDMKPKLANIGGELMDVPPDKLTAVVKADYDKWLKIIKDAGITLD
jgi:tripartite-type tricarboxylate transporter receptor subunit TctC